MAPFFGADNTAPDDALIADFETDLAATFIGLGAATGRRGTFADLATTALGAATDFAMDRIGVFTADFTGDLTADFVATDFAEDLEETAGLEGTLPFGFEDFLATRNPSRFR